MRSFLLNYLLPSAIAGTLFMLLLTVLSPLNKRIGSSIRKVSVIIAMAMFLFPFSMIRFSHTGSKDVTDKQDQTPVAVEEKNDIFQNIPLAAQMYAIGEKTSEALMQTVPEASLLDGSSERSSNMQEAVEKDGIAENEERKTIFFDWMALIVILYLIGAGLTFAAYVLRQMSFLRKLDKTLQTPTPAITQLYSEICDEAQLIRRPILMQSDRIVSPIIVGAVRPVIILPDTESSDIQLRYAIIHELTHYRHRDLFLKLAAVVVAAVHWFNPAAWLLKKTVIDVCEEHCDESIAGILSKEGRIHYAEAMLHFAENGVYGATGLAMPSQKLKQRLQKMLHPAKKTTAKKSLAAVIVSLMLVASALIGCSFAAGAMLQGRQIDSTVFSPNRLTAVDTSSVGGYLWPLLDSTTVANTFSEEHEGIDIAENVGSAVYAANDGEVVEIGHRDDEYGNYIILSHQDGFETVYGGNGTVHVERGDLIKKGEHIASLEENAETGVALLHFEMWENGVKVDPLPHLYLLSSDSNSDNAGELKLSNLTDMTLLWPVQDSTEINVHFGWRTLHGQLDLHEGIVVKAEEGTPIVAITGGTVLETGTSKQYGNYVKIDHGMGLVAIYANADGIVSADDRVKSGQELGVVSEPFAGSKGDVDFYFELRLSDEPLSPKSLTTASQVLLDAAIPKEYVAEMLMLASQAQELKMIDEAERILDGEQNGLLAWPTGPYQFISRGWTGTHQAIDIAGKAGTAIYAAEGGTVVTADWSNAGYGYHIIIDHGNGMQTLYAQMSELLVDEGQIVTRGEMIGLMGSSGNSTGVHLHFEVRIDGEKVPAEPYLGLSDGDKVIDYPTKTIG